MPNAPCEIIELAPDRQEAAFRLAFRDLEDAQHRVQVEAFRDAESAPLPCPARAWGAVRGKVLAGALVTQAQPGQCAFLWPPRLINGEPPETAARLCDVGVQSLAQTGFRMVQALLPTDAGGDADTLRRAGFHQFSDLLYLVCLDDQFPTVEPTSEFEFLPIEKVDERQFAQLVEATYEGTLDCPAANGLRDVDDVLLGYRATGQYRPDWWLTVRRGGEDVGCLIVCDHPQHDVCELIYMGLVPAARGKGCGTAIVRHGLWLAATARRRRLVLAVDAANEPALRMYAAAGFQAWDRKSVFIREMP